jgi:SAM-dependent methyltransferase
MKPVDLYLRVRDIEGRLYPDQIARDLPAFPNDHPHKVEWMARADSADRLIHYLVRLPTPLFILELGCGNGWLSHKISTIPRVHIWGLDRSGIELTQAVRLFSAPNIGFLRTDIFQSPFILSSFDVIVLASVIQYFPDLPALITNLHPLLTKGGEIHLMDSPIYNKKELESARQRSLTYYNALGFPEMADHYFHHSTDELDTFTPHWLYRPDSWRARFTRLLGKNNSPFPWLYIS